MKLKERNKLKNLLVKFPRNLISNSIKDLLSVRSIQATVRKASLTEKQKAIWTSLQLPIETKQIESCFLPKETEK